MRGLAGQAAVVTGGGSGIGAACAARLAAEGVTVAVAGLRAGAAEDVAAAIIARGGRAVAIGCDVTREDQVALAVDRCASELGGLHLLVNSAGIAPAEGGVTACAPGQWNTVMAVNVRGAFLLSSVFGFRASRGECAYAASKAAIVHLTRQMSLDHARDGIRVNCVCPSDCDTPMIDALVADEADPAAAKAALDGGFLAR